MRRVDRYPRRSSRGADGAGEIPRRVHRRDDRCRTGRRDADDPRGGDLRALSRCPPRSMLYLTIIGGVFVAWLVIALLFTPHVPYHIGAPIDAGSDHFIHVLESTCQTHLEHGNRVEVFTNGDAFYPA